MRLTPAYRLISLRAALRAGALLICFALLASLASQALAWSQPASALPLPAGHETAVLHPSVSVDSTGKVHATWLRINWNNGAFGDLWYKRGTLSADGASVSWEAPQALAGQQVSVINPPRIVADNNGVIHLAAGGLDGKVYYLSNAQRGNAGAWRSELVVIPGTSYYGMDLNLDAANVPYIAWGEGLGDGKARVMYSYRLGANSWTGRMAVTPAYYLARSVRMVIQGSGASARVHLLYEHQPDSRTPMAAGYASGTRGGTFAASNFGARFGFAAADNPALAIDQGSGRIYAGFVRGSTSTNYYLMLTQSTNGGSSWAQPATLSLGANVWPGAPWFFATSNGLHIVSEQKFWNGSSITGVRIYYQSFNASNGTYSNPVMISTSGEKALRPVISLGAIGKVVIWTINNTGSIRYNSDRGGVTVAPTATRPPSATATRTRTNTTTGPTATRTRTRTPLPGGWQRLYLPHVRG